ncbi:MULTISPECIES: hypothetical protein [unclassified Microbulbifer]|uniref:hypothetical protein n=1 Tax=unclassified Microbulbifer TaxID=2619833 RepID=UPI0027E4ADD0|nr:MULTISPECIES: hypothetical protein [unclassified Microbulbifer]
MQFEEIQLLADHCPPVRHESLEPAGDGRAPLLLSVEEKQFCADISGKAGKNYFAQFKAYAPSGLWMALPPSAESAIKEARLQSPPPPVVPGRVSRDPHCPAKMARHLQIFSRQKWLPGKCDLYHTANKNPILAPKKMTLATSARDLSSV